MVHRVFIVEDHLIMRSTLCDFINTLPGFQTCGTARTGEEAIDALAEVQADFVLVDVSLPKMSGIALVEELSRRYPELTCLMLTAHPRAKYVSAACAAGARGYILKGDPYEIEKALRSALEGETYLSDKLSTVDEC